MSSMVEYKVSFHYDHSLGLRLVGGIWLQDFLQVDLSKSGMFGKAKRYSLPYFRKFRPEIYLEEGL